LSNKEKLLASAQKYLQKGQVARAIKDYQKLVELEPRDVRMRQKLAELYSRDRRTDEALDAYEAVARHYTDNGFYLKAIAVYKQMQKIDPTRVSIYHQLAELNEKQGLVGNAQAEYRSLVAYYEKNGMLPEAINVLQKMKELEPENLNIRVKIAETHASEGFKEKALEEFQEILDLLRQKQDFPRILKLYDLFLPHFPEDPGLLRGQAESRIEQGDFDRGLETLHGLQLKNPDNPEVLLALGWAYRKQGDFGREQETYLQLLENSPEDLEFREGYILACLNLGDFEQAINELEARKEAFFAAGKVQLLKKCYEQLGDGHADDERVLQTLRSIYELTGEGDKLFTVISAMPTTGDGLDPQDSPSTAEEILEGSVLKQAVEDLEGFDPAGESPAETVAETAEPEGVQAAEEIPLEFLEGVGDPVSAGMAGVENVGPAAEAEEAAAPAEELELELELNLDLDLDLEEEPAPEDPGDRLAPAEAELEAAEELEIILNDDTGPEPVKGELPEEIALVLDEEIGSQGLPDEAGDRLELVLEQELEAAAETSSEADAALAPAASASEDYFDLTGELLDDVETALDGVGEGGAGASLAEGGLSREVGAAVDEIDPEDAESHYNLGIAYKEMGLTDDAIAEFDKAMHNAERALDALTLKGLCLLDQDAFAEAEEIFRSGLDNLPLSRAETTSLRFELGLLYQAWGRPEQALETFETVAAEDSFYRNVGEKLAALREELGRGGGADGRGGKKDRISYV
jgi:tetratricopeptide (TPR) repeat protein